MEDSQIILLLRSKLADGLYEIIKNAAVLLPQSREEFCAAMSRTLKNVSTRTGLKRKTSGTKRAGRILLIAAAVAACGDPNGANGAKPAVSLTESQVETLNKSGAVLNQSVTGKSTTVTVKAAIRNRLSSASVAQG